MMNRTLSTTALLCALIFTTGCAAVVAGAVAGVGVYTWTQGELKRSYEHPFEETVSAAVQSLEYLKITIDSKSQVGSETTIKATRSDGSPATVKIRTVRYNMTEVAVRCGYVGYWDRKSAELIHATIFSTL